MEHGEGEAATPHGRAALRDMATAIARARGALRRSDPGAAVALWSGLVDGRWTLLDHFERGGRHYLVARRNDPLTPSPLALSVREHQVVGYIALGHSVKLVAYELGLAPATVSGHLASALSKLGLRNRAELVSVLATFSGVPSESASETGQTDGAPRDELAVMSTDRPLLEDSPQLSVAERQVVRLVVRGASNRNIASARCTSERTVANQLASIFRKVGVGSRTELAVWAAGARAHRPCESPGLPA